MRSHNMITRYNSSLVVNSVRVIFSINWQQCVSLNSFKTTVLFTRVTIVINIEKKPRWFWKPVLFKYATNSFFFFVISISYHFIISGNNQVDVVNGVLLNWGLLMLKMTTQIHPSANRKTVHLVRSWEQESESYILYSV